LRSSNQFVHHVVVTGTLDDRVDVRLRRVPLDCSLAPLELLGALRDERLPFALTGAWAGGGAIVGSDPLRVAAPDAGALDTQSAAGDAQDAFSTLDRLPRPAEDGRQHPEAVGGGWFGWLGYRLGATIEELPPGPPRPVPLPAFHLAYYDSVLRLDPGGRWWFEALVTEPRSAALDARLASIREALAAPQRADADSPGPLTLGAQHAAHHLDAVADCRRRIAAGEIFQANICLRLETSWAGSAIDLQARALESISPPYAAVFDTPAGGIASLSPELFLRRRGRNVVTAPIKGTIARSSDPAEAAAAHKQLTRSAKDAAEHVMIVDLMRNDLGRVCAYGSVSAPRYPTAEPHPGLWHLVSRVRGELRPGVGDGDLLRATFPPGSVTGAPKVQAMKVIAALEPTAREVYTGAIGYASPIAGLELSVAIRTLELCDGRLWLGAGGGIVADSEPRAELEEALDKARPLAAAVGTRVTLASSAVRAA
jgi:anthranilate/para-aminobenzoate synthase component I